jgi:hypothetical protein
MKILGMILLGLVTLPLFANQLSVVDLHQGDAYQGKYGNYTLSLVANTVIAEPLALQHHASIMPASAALVGNVIYSAINNEAATEKLDVYLIEDLLENGVQSYHVTANHNSDDAKNTCVSGHVELLNHGKALSGNMTCIINNQEVTNKLYLTLQ